MRHLAHLRAWLAGQRQRRAQQRMRPILDALHLVALEDDRAFNVVADRCQLEGEKQRAYTPRHYPTLRADVKRAA